MIWDADGDWIGSLLINPHGLVTHKMTLMTGQILPCEHFELNDNSLKRFCLLAAFDSGVSDDALADMENSCTVLACGWDYEDVMPLKKPEPKIKPSDDPIFDAWMNR